MAQTGITIQNLQEWNYRANKLREMGARNRDITRIFRKASSPLVSAVRRATGKSRKGVTDRNYPSRTHPAGTLKQSVRFVTSKKYSRRYYVLYKSRPGRDTWHETFYVWGVPSRGYKPHPAPGAAYQAKEAQVISRINEGISQLQDQLWKGAK